MECALRAELLPTLSGLPVLPAKLGNTAAIVGAARLILAPASQPALTSQPARIPQL
jgi:glucokinase